MEAAVKSMHQMIANFISSQQSGGTTQSTTEASGSGINQMMVNFKHSEESSATMQIARPNQSKPPFQTPISVTVGLAGKSKTHVRISNPDTKELLTVPIELLNNCDDILTVSGKRKRLKTTSIVSQSDGISGSETGGNCVVVPPNGDISQYVEQSGYKNAGFVVKFLDPEILLSIKLVLST